MSFPVIKGERVRSLTFSYDKSLLLKIYRLYLFFVTPLFCVIPLLVCCAATQSRKVILESAQNAILNLPDSLERFNAVGDVAFSLHGERFRGKIDVSIHDWSRFTCEIYGPFAQSIASITSKGDSACIQVEEKEYAAGIKDDVATIPFFTIYPFIIEDVIRILTGRIIKRNLFEQDPVETRILRGRKEYVWSSDSIHIFASLPNNRKKKMRITYSGVKDSHWKLEFSSFKNRISKEIYFESDEKNYFLLEFKKLIF